MNYSVLFSDDLKLFFPEIFLAFAILIVFMYGVLLSTSTVYNYPLVNKNIILLSCYILLLTLTLTANNSVGVALIFQGVYIQDDLTRSAKIFLLLGSISTLILSQLYFQRSKLNNYEYPLLILFSVLGLNLLISSSDLLSAYLAIELQALSFYVLASFQRRSVFSTEAGLKYFILGAFSSGLILYGFSLIYGVTGSTNLSDLRCFCLNGSFEGSNVLVIGIIFLMAGFLFKIAAFPFHMWSPDVYEGAPSSSTTFFAVVPKLAILVFFSRILLYSFPQYGNIWGNILVFSGLGSIVYAAFVAIKQDSLKRLLAYSSVGHVGFILVALSTNTLEGLEALFFYSVVYMVTSIPTWGLVVSCMEGKNKAQNNIITLAGLATSSPLMAFLGAVALFSLAGIPPLAGFYSKVFIFFLAIKTSMYFVAFLVLGLSVISTFYYIFVIKTIYFEKKKNWIFCNKISKGNSILLAISLVLLFFIFSNPESVMLISKEIALSVVDTDKRIDIPFMDVISSQMAVFEREIQELMAFRQPTLFLEPFEILDPFEFLKCKMKALIKYFC